MKKTAVITLIILTATAAALFFPVPERLCVSEYDSREVVRVFPKNTESFIISYTHSVNRSRVSDYYTLLESGTLFLTDTAFTSYGAGIPEPDGGQTFKADGGAYTISGINLELNELVLQTGVIANHHIEANGGDTAMNDIVEPQTRIIIAVRRVSFFDILAAKGRGQ